MEPPYNYSMKGEDYNMQGWDIEVLLKEDDGEIRYCLKLKVGVQTIRIGPESIEENEIDFWVNSISTAMKSISQPVTEN